MRSRRRSLEHLKSHETQLFYIASKYFIQESIIHVSERRHCLQSLEHVCLGLLNTYSTNLRNQATTPSIRNAVTVSVSTKTNISCFQEEPIVKFMHITKSYQIPCRHISKSLVDGHHVNINYRRRIEGGFYSSPCP
jgi:hypothetical protein